MIGAVIFAGRVGLPAGNGGEDPGKRCAGDSYGLFDIHLERARPGTLSVFVALVVKAPVRSYTLKFLSMVYASIR
ncbi:hypothetical protein C8Z91_20150 [Paenibacillus elgii]|uniref:Uncharacterized protein n=1 Tax=Paenibacillus elgii TaxID=189691 RepID=A0A2T6G0F4_9BACL|nr:hypothetical protein C8Z91_20150 [Paenibacillus elgii]